jgi:hypothetical protein
LNLNLDQTGVAGRIASSDRCGCPGSMPQGTASGGLLFGVVIWRAPMWEHLNYP